MTNDHISLTEQQKLQVRNKTRDWLDIASRIWSRKFSTIPVHFDLRGKTSGMYVVRGTLTGKTQKIRFNPAILSHHFDDSCATTIPHEVAHHICYELHGRKAKPHGKEWRVIMQAFGVPAEATCKLDLSDIPQKQLKRFDYACACRKHQLTS
ncbi:MAG: SprT-like domain-containing protein, partial [Pseudohongiellaceae bacterium]